MVAQTNHQLSKIQREISLIQVILFTNEENHRGKNLTE